MLLERYYDDSLAQASYLIGCESAGDAIVIDPNRDIDRHVRAAAAHRLRIRYVTETHIHADFLSGSRQLAASARATLLLSGHGGAEWSYGYAAADGARLIHDGDALQVGKVRLDVVHSPGHTPEHVSFLVTDTAAGEQPMGMISGDFIFVGDVGRPDLLERAANVAGSMDGAARQLYASLRRTNDLPDFLQIWPGHGAGSACGKSLGAVPQSTLGYERLINPAFRHASEDAFVRWVLADQPEPPRYFATMKRLNRDGPPARPDGELARLEAAAVESALQRGQWVVDVRGTKAYAQSHAPGTINIPASRTLPTYAGTVLTYDRPIALIAQSAEQAAQARGQLALIGLDDVAGWAPADLLPELERLGRPLERSRTIQASALATQLPRNGMRVIDVRGTAEWDGGHLPMAQHIYLGDLADRAAEMRPDEPLVVHCQTGTRASIAASLLRARGFRDVTVLSDGYEGWRRAGLPVSTDGS